MVESHVLELAEDFALTSSDPVERQLLVNAVQSFEPNEQGVVTNFDDVYQRYTEALGTMHQIKYMGCDQKPKPNDLLGSFVMQYRSIVFPNQFKC